MATQANVRAGPRETPSVGTWQPVSMIGEGRWSRVFRARPKHSPPDWPADYALKQLRPDDPHDAVGRRLLCREGVVGQAVSHAHVVPVLSLHMDATPPFLVMPCLEGATLAAALQCSKPFAVPHALWLTRQVADGLDAIHQAGFLHADVKPDNVHLSSGGHATLIDLGGALKLKSRECAPDGPFQGTIGYAAPEMICAATPVAQSGDVYSLGVTLYQMLTGRRPFHDDDPGQVVRAQMIRPVPDPRRFTPQVPTPVGRLVRTMLSREPLRRPALDELAVRLAELEIDTFDDRGIW